MKEISIIGVDLAKNVFQLHGATADGTVLFRKKLSRPQFQRFMAEHPQCLVVMEACGGAHHWAREMERVGHEVRLIAPRYVKPFIKRQKNDAADAEAIVEAALRPTMRYVEPKTGDQQARSILFRTREQFVKQRTEAVNALRSHLYEFGYIAPEGIGYPALRIVAIRPEDRQEGRAVVVVAERDVHRHRQRGDAVAQVMVGRDLAPVGQVSSQQDEGGVRVIAGDDVQRFGQPRAGVQTVDRDARRAKVQVGQDDELERAHSAMPRACR